MADQTNASHVIGGVVHSCTPIRRRRARLHAHSAASCTLARPCRDTHKDLHVAAIVDHQDRVLGTKSFATTRQGYRLMLTWMRSFGDLQRVGIDCSGSYGAGLLRYLQNAGVEVLEGELANGLTNTTAAVAVVRKIRKRSGGSFC